MYFVQHEQNDVHYGPEGRVFYGSVTVGERGQVVIPAQARRDHDIASGQKLIVLGNADGIAMLSIDTLLAVLGDSAELLTHLKRALGGS
jgi:AbrB family looped-hinge helix DNA binding protein